MIKTIIYLFLIWTPTKENVLEECKRQGLLFPKIVTRQSIWETGNWPNKCNGCSYDWNNIFGLRNKKNITPDNPMGYYEYVHWSQSVKGYKRLFQKKYSGGDYYLFLEKIGYAEDTNYVKNLKRIRL